MLLIRTKSGAEIRVPVEDIDSITEVEMDSGEERPVPPHPFVHREGATRCAGCWRDRFHPAHAAGGR